MNLFSPQAFWLVWSPTGATSPKFQHDTRASAVAEAERLARLKPGHQFFALAVTDCRVVDDMVRTSFTVDNGEPPF